MKSCDSFSPRLQSIPLILFLLLIPLMFTCSYVAENRMRAFAVPLGIGIIIHGIQVYAKQDTAFLGLFKRPFHTGRAARLVGAFMMVAGVLIAFWSVVFWLRLVLSDVHG